MCEDLLQYIIVSTHIWHRKGAQCTQAVGQDWLGFYLPVSSVRERPILLILQHEHRVECLAYIIYIFLSLF